MLLSFSQNMSGTLHSIQESPSLSPALTPPTPRLTLIFISFHFCDSLPISHLLFPPPSPSLKKHTLTSATISPPSLGEMGNPKHGIGSSIKALFNLRPLGPKTMTWVCAQQARTDSFREVYKNFNSMYSTSSSSMSKEERSLTALPPTQEESISTSCSSTLTTESLPKEAACTRRFFFSPCTTKSILEEEDHSAKKTAAMDDDKEEEEAFVKELCFETEENRGEEEIGFCKKSVRLSMESEDPYMDFRSSMEEMVEAHGLKDWSCLEELLHCYLKLNDEDTHKFIVLAFVDLLMAATMEEEPKQGSSQVESSCSSCLSFEEIKEGKIDKQEGKEEEIEHINLF